MKRLLILVEGFTEERFVNLVIRDHLLAHSVISIPRILHTRRVDNGPNFKGGVTSWEQIKRDLSNLLGDTNAGGITTMIDYYGLPSEVPGMSTRKGSPGARVAHVENAIAGHFNDRRLRPFLMLHEFEAMLFTDINKWGYRFDDAAALARLKNDVAGLEPEDINETRQTAPSKRILRRLESYEKPFHGPDALKDIGLDAIREACRISPHGSPGRNASPPMGMRRRGRSTPGTPRAPRDPAASKMTMRIRYRSDARDARVRRGKRGAKVLAWPPARSMRARGGTSGRVQS